MRIGLINLSLRPVRNENLYRLIFACSLGAVTLVTAGNLVRIARYGWDIHVVKGDLEAKHAVLADLDAREAVLGGELRELDSSKLKKRSEFANMAILNRVFSWTGLFNELEKVMPIDARLGAVRPNVTAEGQIDLQLEGTAKNYGAFVDLEEALMRSESFSRVYPGTERLKTATYRTRAPNLPLRQRGAQAGAKTAAARAKSAGEVAFSLSCEYFPGGRNPEDSQSGGAQP
ncbi:MAG: hypothetical protein V3S71_05720 [Acidobacteriota bacterium]